MQEIQNEVIDERFDINILDGIVFMRYNITDFLDEKTIKEGSKLSKKVSNGLEYPYLLDLGQVGNIDKKGMIWGAGKESLDHVLALAIIINNPVHKFLANYYIKVIKPIKATKMFTDYTEAINWLGQYKFLKK